MTTDLKARLDAAEARLMARKPEACKCDFAHYMTGDGCDVCNPAKGLEYAKETIQDLKAQVKALTDACKPFIPPMPPSNAICHTGLMPQDDCAFCNRVKAARVALKGGQP